MQVPLHLGGHLLAAHQRGKAHRQQLQQYPIAAIRSKRVGRIQGDDLVVEAANEAHRARVAVEVGADVQVKVPANGRVDDGHCKEVEPLAWLAIRFEELRDDTHREGASCAPSPAAEYRQSWRPG